MAHVFLSLGTNKDRHLHLAQAHQALSALFGDVRYSSIFESEAVGFKGDPFFNLVAEVHTSLSIKSLSEQLKAIEDANGRDRSAPKFSGRSLDIDLLTYDNQVGNAEGIQLPRPETVKEAFVLWPMAELAPQHYHPGTESTYPELWADFQQTQPMKAQALWKIESSMEDIIATKQTAASVL